MFAVKIHARSKIKSGHAEILTGIVVTVLKKLRGEGNLPASSTAVCAEGQGAEASKSIDRDCCGPAASFAAWLLPDSA